MFLKIPVVSLLTNAAAGADSGGASARLASRAIAPCAAASHRVHSAAESLELHWQPADGDTAGAAASVRCVFPHYAVLVSLSFHRLYLTGSCSYRGEGKVGVNRDDMRETLAKRMYETAAAVVLLARCPCLLRDSNKIREFGGQLPSEILKQAGRKPAASKTKPAEPDEFDRTIEEVSASVGASCRPPCSLLF